jgi:glycosyltransferase involved in cell wall biosynthesis
MPAKVSILVAGYNYFAHLFNIRTMLTKLSEQVNVDVIFVDDYSTDGSFEEISSFKFNILKIFRNNKNLGLTQSLNIAASYATGDIFLRWDVDDYFTESRVAEVQSANSSGFNFHVMDAISIMPCGRFIKKISVPRRKMTSKFVAFRRNPFVHGGTSFSKDLFFSHGGYDTHFKYSQDYELWTRFLCDKNLKLKKLNSIYHLLIHNESISATKKETQRNYFLQARQRYWKEHLLC